MFAVFGIVLCLMAVSHSAPLACEDLVRPLDQLESHHLEGRWALVAGSLNDTATADVLKGRESVTIYFHNSTYTQANRFEGPCESYSHNFSMEGHILKMKVKTFNFTVNFFHTSCQDCVVFSLAAESPNYESVDFYLFSRRREVEQKVMDEFKAQVECLNMPPLIIMDPTKELCPEQTASKPAAPTEEKTEGQKA